MDWLFLAESMDSYGFPLFSPPWWFRDCGSGRDEEPSGERVLRLIQIRLATPSLPKITPTSQDNSVNPNRSFEFAERGLY
jgi:hypothetical protein